MFQELFIKIITMSLTAIPIVIVVLIARMFLKAKPKIFSYALWGVVLFRLICPFSFEASFSFVPEKLASGEVIDRYAEAPVDDAMIYESDVTENNVERNQEKNITESVTSPSSTILSA